MALAAKVPAPASINKTLVGPTINPKLALLPKLVDERLLVSQ